MYSFSNPSQLVVAICSLLCLIQVMNWFEEIKESFNENSRRYFWMGRRFDILPNRSFIIDDSLKVYGLNLNIRHQLN